MEKTNKIYYCAICGRIVEELHEGRGGIICCGQEMTILEEKTTEEGLTEKHLPIIEVVDDVITIKLSSVEHPMIPEHFIEWIEVIVDNKSYKQFLTPTDPPVAHFNVSGKNITARAYCNLHGLWLSKV